MSNLSHDSSSQTASDWSADRFWSCSIHLPSSVHFTGPEVEATRSHAIDDHAYFSSAEADDSFRGTIIALRLSVNVRVDPKLQRRRHSVLSRQARNCFGSVGIQNPGSACYANALLQVLFHNTITRRAILNLDSRKAPSGAGAAVLQLQALCRLGRLGPTKPSLESIVHAL